MTQSGISTYGQSLPTMNYLKNEMAPPTGRAPETETSELKSDRYSQSNGSDRYSQSNAPGDAVQEHEPEYLQDQGSAYNNRGSYTYTTSASVEHSQLTPEMTGSPQQNGSGRMTPRTSVSGPGTHWTSGYNTPPRPTAATTLYNAVSDTRSTPANGASDPYSMASTTTPVYSTLMNGNMGSGNKRMREDDDVLRTDSGNEYESKRRKTITDATLGGPILQPTKPSGVMAHRR